MALNRDFVGRSYPAADTFEVGREHIRQFADAIGDPNPIYRDRQLAIAAGHRDTPAPPTFLIALNFRFPDASPITDQDLRLDYSRIVHGEQQFSFHRPVYAGDVLSVVLRVTDIRDVGRNELMTTVMDVSDAAGSPVGTLTATLISRDSAAPKESTL